MARIINPRALLLKISQPGLQPLIDIHVIHIPSHHFLRPMNVDDIIRPGWIPKLIN
ncbi:MAG: hypothetical protein KH367_10065 [Ruminococcus sp.]|nr:hypothetical protein [Ruminococcus sp.]